MRGLDSLKWAIYFNQPLGNTLHFVDSSIDDGEIIFQEKIDLFKGDSLDELIDKMYHEEIKMLINFEAHLSNPLALNLPRTKPNMRMPKKLEEHVLRDLISTRLNFLPIILFMKLLSLIKMLLLETEQNMALVSSKFRFSNW